MVERPMLAFFAQKAEGDQSPAHQHDLAFTSVPVQADHGLEGLRRYVVRLAELWHRRPVHVEVLSDPLLV
jgi:hypothetical protein